MSIEQQESLRNIIKSLEVMLTSMMNTSAQEQQKKHCNVHFAGQSLPDEHDLFRQDIDLTDIFTKCSDVQNLIKDKRISSFEGLKSTLMLNHGVFTDIGTKFVGHAVTYFIKHYASDIHGLLVINEKLTGYVCPVTKITEMQYYELIKSDQITCNALEFLNSTPFPVAQNNKLYKMFILAAMTDDLKRYYVDN